MNKKDFVDRVARVLRSNDIRKAVPLKKQEFSITNADGKKATFVVRPDSKNVLYTADDVANIIDACIAVAIDAIKNGDEIAFRGFGTLGVIYRAARKTRVPGSGAPCDVSARYVPKFLSGNDLKRAAKVYGLNREARSVSQEVGIYGDY